MALQKWLAEHPHLTELARLHEVIKAMVMHCLCCITIALMPPS